MSYLFEDTSVDELVLMVASAYNGRRPEPWDPADLERVTDKHRREEMERARAIRTPIVGPGYCYLNMTENLRECWRQGYIVESTSQGFVIHLTWKGWARVDELLAAGHHIPTEEELSQYASDANRALGILNDITPPTERGVLTRDLLEPFKPATKPKRIPWILRVFGVTPKETA